MTPPLTPEAVAQMVDDRKNAMSIQDALETLSAMASVQDGYAKKATDRGLRIIHKANAKAQREVAATVTTLAAENATLRAERDAMTERATDAELNWTNCTRLAQRLRASEAAALERMKVLEAGLADPVSVHANMLRGAIAMPSFANIKHLYAAEFAALTPTADKEPTT